MLIEEPLPGFKWPVAVARPIAAPAEKVWDVISMPGNLELCHPFCKRNPVQVWPGPDSRDEVHYFNDLILERRFRQWNEGVGYDLEIGTHRGRTSYVAWRISPADARNCTLTITVYAHVLQKFPVVVRWLPHVIRLRPMLRKYLESVTKGFERYVTRGEPVVPDQFGRHAWFSAAQS